MYVMPGCAGRAACFLYIPCEVFSILLYSNFGIIMRYRQFVYKYMNAYLLALFDRGWRGGSLSGLWRSSKTAMKEVSQSVLVEVPSSAKFVVRCRLEQLYGCTSSITFMKAIILYIFLYIRHVCIAFHIYIFSHRHIYIYNIMKIYRYIGCWWDNWSVRETNKPSKTLLFLDILWWYIKYRQ